MTVISLLTDFGLRDGYVGVMKGVILGIAPQVQIVDITHAIRAQDVREGAVALGRCAAYFPPGTVHVAVVDPGVGTRRRGMAAHLGAQFFIGPDNGLFTLLYQQARQNGEVIEMVHLTQPRFWLPQVSNVFHGRDVFAPVAAHLANGVSLEELGERMDDPVLLDLPQPERIPDGWRGQVMVVDNFGNLSTNLSSEHMAGFKLPGVRIAGRKIKGMVKTFGEAETGALVAMFGEENDLAIAVVNGSAAEELGAGAGTVVEVVELGGVA
jgi:S-adenosyl-L-methionine hydrolase (adenosine-forming)